jgi:hypothetical protein
MIQGRARDRTKFVQRMECIEDKCGILAERFLMEHRTRGAVSVVLVSTPSWWDIYVPVSTSGKVRDTQEALCEFLTPKA